VWSAVWQGTVPVLGGIVAGLIATGLLAPVNRRLLGISSFDPPAIVGVAALLVLFTVVASYLPARRITAADAARALRCE
jgi:putative ABC transport system permease protein